MAVLSYICESLATDCIVTKRDIYYRDVALFRTQRTVDIVIDQIAGTLEVPRYENVMSLFMNYYKC